MTGINNNNNKFVPSTPKTYTVLELRDQQQPIKQSSLSVAARSKVINKSGSNYLSESRSYGPCKNSLCGCSCSSDSCTCVSAETSIYNKGIYSVENYSVSGRATDSKIGGQ